MGALLHPDVDATTFRVWAPFATSVSVAGTFNGWSTTAHPLGPEGNGYWSADVAGVHAGHQYRYVMNGTHWRIDPRALAVTNSVGNGLIVDTRYDWQHPFQAPPWNEMVVYEMHTRTFPSTDFKVAR
jgi:1,4-alpha-glucan branching enzyme